MTQFSRRSFLKTSAAGVAAVASNQSPAANPIDVRKIIPPNLDDAYLGQKILCYRPMRHGSPNLSVAQVGNKVVAHNYGHGGSGWTLGPGSANYVNTLMINSQYAKELSNKSTPIAIIGAGVIGLFTAYDLNKRGYNNITIYADRVESLTSHNAGGLLAPVSMDNAPDMQATIDQIGIDAYRFYDGIAKNKNADFKGGALIVPTYFNDREDSGLEPYVGKVMQPAKEVVLDFDNGTTRKMVAYDDGIYMDTATLMGELNQYMKAHNIQIVKQKINSFSGVKEKFIFNCSGLGSSQLANDAAVIPVQGHLIMLKNQDPKNMNYMILVYFGEGKSEANQKTKRSFYIFPKRLANTAPQDIGVIGGTFIEGGNPNTPNLKEFDVLLKGAKDFYGIS
ncbi:FAD-dependent oxidoreductase [Polynucleobacter sp. MWH-Braz-FAM2G]|uniref:FAD-dependent oxidoreductase n=1 Tax=Polynucleobacter sp. MWH-Braz-FAM2G TaxID=1855883 RepID=UPI001BFEB728|nr:FAD-dependent oxidoreductase [Polynucleobacter sp. MWH-Braz-FAM2G]QWD90398.1 FAD-dependent oxidoreductase [Polynucleobacter sp. MWH-Braz-FAM2G]